MRRSGSRNLVWKVKHFIIGTVWSVYQASSTLCRINLKTQLWERKRNKCSASTLERFRWLFTFKISYSSPCWLLGKINYMTKWRQRIRKVADTKSSPSTLIQKSIVFKRFHSGERFQKVPFLWIFLCILVWTEAVSVTIKLHFQIYPA